MVLRLQSLRGLADGRNDTRMQRRGRRRLVALCALRGQDHRFAGEIKVANAERLDAPPTKTGAARQNVRQGSLPAGHSRNGLGAGLGHRHQLGKFLGRQRPAYMVMGSLAWSLKAWAALLLPEEGRWQEKHGEEKRKLLRMDFSTFRQAMMRVPAQIVATGRRIVYRLLGWNPWQQVFFRLWDHLRQPLRC
jgi:hypothetical protein